MRSITYCLLLLLWGCSPQAYFKSANNVSKKKVTLYRKNESPSTGILTVPFEENFNFLPGNTQSVKFIPDGKTTEESIDVKAIVGYSYENNYYALKEIYLLSTNTNHLLFVKRLTGADSRIQLYELYETGRGNHLGESKYTYFISLPNQEGTINTDNIQLIPDFDQKMSKFVADCPALADKIRDKEYGYFIPFVSFNTYKHREVMLKIINEYNNCK